MKQLPVLMRESLFLFIYLFYLFNSTVLFGNESQLPQLTIFGSQNVLGIILFYY